jgi:hypothetical protein
MHSPRRLLMVRYLSCNEQASHSLPRKLFLSSLAGVSASVAPRTAAVLQAADKSCRHVEHAPRPVYCHGSMARAAAAAKVSARRVDDTYAARASCNRSRRLERRGSPSTRDCIGETSPAVV